MSIDLSQFIATFLEESYEGLEIMESSLLNFDSADEETINTIFRAAHSIKGGAGTFGFNEIAEFTHVVETLLDELRSGKQNITPELINLLLESVDCIKALLEASQDGPDADAGMIQNVHARLQQALGAEPSPAPDNVSAGIEEASDHSESAEDNRNEAWEIVFIPNTDLLQSGHEPAFMFEALADFGDLKVEPSLNKLLAFSKLNPEDIYISWRLVLESDCSEEEVREVFEWVEDECELKVNRIAVADTVITATTDVQDSGWKISFIPEPALLETGNEPSFMFEALADLGKIRVDVHTSKLPVWEQLNPEKVYLSWDVTLISDCSEEEVREVFEWVEDECELSVTAIGSSPAVQHIETPVTSTKMGGPAAESPPLDEATLDPSVPAAGSVPVDEKLSATPSARKPKAAVENSSIRVDTDKIDALINRVGELVITQAMLGQVGEELAEVATGSELERLQAGLDQLERNTRDLQEDVMRVRMLPISFVFNRFPRLVHDVSGKLGKKVELIITGEQTEIDKTVMEKIGDPMVHLIRNSLDHGLEFPEERVAAGKPETGKVQLNAYHQSGFIIIDIIDDGRGLNTQKIYEKALENGLITADQQLSDIEINELIFKAGFSTADAVSDLSGRGVGMDVVRRNIESLGGHVRVKSEPGYGSTFSVSLPLTLAILDGQLIRILNQTYIIPLVSIVETILADKKAISPIAGENKLLHFRDEYIPLINLRTLFKLPQPDNESDNSLIAIVENGGQKVGLIVDELYGQQQVVIKSLEVNFKRIEGFAGATILGDGSVALILDIAGLMKRGLDYATAQAAKKRNEIFKNDSGQGGVA